MFDKSRQIFEISTLVLLALAFWACFSDLYQAKTNLDLVNGVGVIFLFATSGAFVISTGVDVMLGFAEHVRKLRFEKGRQEGLQEAQRKIQDWLESEKRNGTRFQNDPPDFSNSDHGE